MFVEDPGAANYAIGIPSLLRREGFDAQLLCDGPATGFLADRGEDAEPIGDASATDVISRLAASLIVVGTGQNPNSFSHALVEAAKATRIPTAGFVDMAADAELRFRGGTPDPLRFAPDFLAVADMATRDAFLQLGFPSERIRVCGHPAFDRLVERRKLFPPAEDIRRNLFPACEQGRPVVVFVAEHPDAQHPERSRRTVSYTLHGRGHSDERVHIVLDEMLDALEDCNPRPFVVVRLHPKNSIDEFERYRSEVDFFSVGGDALPLIIAANVVVAMTSMLGLEALVLERPVVTVVPHSGESSLMPEALSEAVPPATTKTAFRYQLFQALSQERQIVAARVGSKRLLGGRRRFIEFLTGLAGQSAMASRGL